MSPCKLAACALQQSVRDGGCRGMPMYHDLQPHLMRAQRLQSRQRSEPPHMRTLLPPAAMHPASNLPLCFHLSHRFGHALACSFAPPPPPPCCLSRFVVSMLVKTAGYLALTDQFCKVAYHCACYMLNMCWFLHRGIMGHGHLTFANNKFLLV